MMSAEFRYPWVSVITLVILVTIACVWIFKTPLVMERETRFHYTAKLVHEEQVDHQTMPDLKANIYTRPIPYWIIGVSSMLVKQSLVLERLITLGFVLVCLTVFFVLLKSVLDHRHAFYSILVLFTSYQCFYSSILALPDMYGLCIHALAMVFLARAMFLNTGLILNSIGTGVFCGLAVHTMGVAALTIPGVTLAVFLAAQSIHVIPREWRVSKNGFLVLGWETAMLIVSVVSIMFIYCGFITSPEWTGELSNFTEKTRQVMGLLFGQHVVQQGSLKLLAMLVIVLIISVAGGIFPFFTGLTTEPLRDKSRKIVLAAFIALLALAVISVPVNLKSYQMFGEKYLESLSTYDRHNEHSGKSDYYLRAISIGLFPWSLFIPFVFIYIGLTRKENTVSVEVFFLSWALAAFSVYTIIEKKFFYFFTPALAPFAVVIVIALLKYFDDPEKSRYRFAILATLGYTAIVFKDISMIDAPLFLNHLIEEKLYLYENLRMQLSIFFYALITVSLLNVLMRKPRLSGLNGYLLASILLLIYQIAALLLVGAK